MMAMQRSLSVVAALLLFLQLFIMQQPGVLSQGSGSSSSPKDNSVCKGVFDFYFVLDRYN